MRNPLFLLMVATFVLSACRKSNNPVGPDPVAAFSLATADQNSDTSLAIRIGTNEALSLKSESVNADAYFWDFGNGTISTEQNPTGHYEKSGTYTLTLTASTKDGRKSVVSRPVKVLDRIARQINVLSLNRKSALGWGATYPNSGKLNVWVEILQAAPGRQYPLSRFGIPQAPLVYKTAVINNVDASNIPLSFDVSDKLIIDIPTISRSGYIFNLYGQDNTGTYLLISNYGSGVGSSLSGNAAKNRFEITTGFDGTNLSLQGNYE